MKKKIAAFVLAAALVLPTSLTAFAATPSDVIGKPIQSAVEELTALGIIGGYEDGSFKPDNEITRAELAKIIVIASGNGAAATTLQTVKSAFTDVKSNEWYTGYINAAQAKGYIQGYNGKFRPSDNVKNEEVVAVLVRALGYQENKLTGAWPYNYLIAAQSDETNIIGNVTIVAGKNATRGDVAQLSSNTLNQNTVSYNADGNLVVSATKKLINKIGDTTEGVLASSTIKDKLLTLNDKTVTVDDNFLVTGGKSLTDLLGHDVTLLWNKAKTKVIAVSDSQDASKIVTGKVTTTSSVYGGTADAVKLTVGSAKNSYTVAPEVTVFSNFVKQAATSTAKYELAIDTNASIILDNAGKVRFVNVTAWTNNAVVSSYEAATSYRKAYLEFRGTAGSINLLPTTKITINGAAATAADIKQNDVVRYINTSGDASVVEVTRKAVTGTVSSSRTKDNDKYYTIAGTEYKDVSNTELKFSTEYTVYLNADNAIAYSTSPNSATSTNYGVLVADADNNNNAGYSILVDGVLVGGNTKVVYYSIKDNKNVTVYTKVAGINALKDGDIVNFTYNKDNVITEFAKGNAANAAQVVSEVSTSQIKTTSATSTTSTYLINSNTVVVDATGLASDVVTVSELAKVKAGNKVAVASANGIYASVIVITEGGAATTGDIYGLFAGRSESVSATNAKTYTVTLKVNGVDTDYTVTSAGYAALDTAAKNTVVKIKGTVVTTPVRTAFADAAAKLPTADINTENKTFKTVDGTTTSWIATNAQVYVIDADGNLSVGQFSEVRAAANASLANVTVTVYGSGSSLGSFQEAAVIVVKKTN